jgi:hypothetical protein
LDFQIHIIQHFKGFLEFLDKFFVSKRLNKGIDEMGSSESQNNLPGKTFWLVLQPIP